MIKFKYLLLSLVSSLVLLAVPASASAFNLFGGACGTGGGSSSVCKNQSSTNPLLGPDGVLVKVTHLVAIIGGIAAVVIIFVGGFHMVTSQGESDKVAKGRNTVIGAVIGLVIIVLAQAIISFVLSRI